jgi:hypothetical protein
MDKHALEGCRPTPRLAVAAPARAVATRAGLGGERRGLRGSAPKVRELFGWRAANDLSRGGRVSRLSLGEVSMLAICEFRGSGISTAEHFAQ